MARRHHLIPAWYHLCMAMTLRLPDDLDAKLTERAHREGRSKQELAIEAIRDAQDRAEVKVDDVLAELMDSDTEILDYLK
ncbi:CopG-like domain-containing protein DNA-binding protein [Actinobacteria bacterium OK074]|nr:CopG-like domain-containing protein DNA-binding protein [Actinobacteria bacterium OK074]